mgnify:FL=1
MLHNRILFKVLFFALLSLSISLSGYANAVQLPKLSEKAFVSIVTCSPTPNYEGGFGHSALRIQDSSLHIDVIFNFGSYSEKQSFFAYKVLLGTIVSYLNGESFKEFADRYKKNGRGMNEYYLNLTEQQKQSLWQELNRILISGERFYEFKVPTENCSTQLRDVLFKQCNWDKEAFLSVPTHQTYRDIELNDPLQNCWLHLLFNIVVGPETDRIMNLYQAAFNPTGLIELLKEVHQDGKPILMMSHKIFPPTQFKELPDKAIPLSVFSLLFIVATILTYLQLKKAKHFFWFDRIILLLSGISGCFLLSLILFSKIDLLNSNYNILWALPTNLILAFLLKANKIGKWRKAGIALTCLSLIIFPIAAAIGGQNIPAEAYLFAGTLFVRLLSYLKPV